jgi:hypothetical protein
MTYKRRENRLPTQKLTEGEWVRLIDWSYAPASWRAGHAGPGSGEDAVGCCCCAYERADGTWAGGKYEWHVRPPRRRSYENIKAGYNGWEAPRSGTPIILWVHTADNNRVSEQVEAVWP